MLVIFLMNRKLRPNHLHSLHFHVVHLVHWLVELVRVFIQQVGNRYFLRLLVQQVQHVVLQVLVFQFICCHMLDRSYSIIKLRSEDLLLHLVEFLLFCLEKGQSF